MGRRHVTALRASGFDVVGICDNNPEALTSAGEALSIPTHAQFVKPEQLRRLQPDCVVVATTAPSHCQLTCLAADAGVRYILCEKPMAVSLAECDTMIEVADHAGATLAINHQMRFMERFLETLRIVRSENLGAGSMTVVAGNFGLGLTDALFRGIPHDKLNARAKSPLGCRLFACRTRADARSRSRRHGPREHR